ncbi:MAG TPA: hypothetical protein VFT67_00465 [Jatrophihabitantaceae bacterium]|nr:hypothetical protein [Jatrophihabitantaceae bacterium]
MVAIPTGLPTRATVPVQCDRCGTEVLVGKTSWQQTSVQWPDCGTSGCPELSAAVPHESMVARVRGCPALQRSITKAALAGSIQIPE